MDLFEAVGANARGLMSDADFRDLEDHACPGPGACGGQFTANTMALALEFLGLSPIGSASPPAMDKRKEQVAYDAGKLVVDQLKRGLTPKQILTRLAFENAIAGVAATGGSTNAVLHLLAIAREVGVPLTIDDFDTVSARTPTLADLKPGGRFVAADLDRAGGTALVAHRLIEGGKLDGSQLTPHRPHAGRGIRRRRRGPRPGGRRDDGAPAQADRRAGDPQGEPRPRGLRRQGRRPRARLPQGPRPRLRPRGGRHGRRPGRARSRPATSS